MKQSQFQRGVFVLMTAIGLLLFAILITLLTKDSWHLMETGHTIALISVLVLFPIYGLTCQYKGKMDERNRERARIDSTYQTEPHGIRFSQHRREG